MNGQRVGAEGEDDFAVTVFPVPAFPVVVSEELIVGLNPLDALPLAPGSDPGGWGPDVFFSKSGMSFFIIGAHTSFPRPHHLLGTPAQSVFLVKNCMRFDKRDQ